MIAKKFSKSYDEALTQAYVFHTQFLTDQADFEAYSARFADPFAADFLDLINDADDIPTNENDLNNQTLITNQVEQKMEECRLQFQKLLLHVGFAYPGDASILKVFGNLDYENSRRVPARLINLLEDAHREADSVTYKASLIAVGFVQTEITKLKTLADELKAKLNEQQVYIRNSSLRADERAEAFNKVWDQMTAISNASKMLFKDNQTKVDFYLLYPEGPGPGSLTAPQNFMFDPVNYEFTWSAVANATSYILQESTDGTNWSQYWSGAELTCGYEESPTTMMYFRVLAHNSGGNSAPSNTLTYDFAPVLVAPSNLNYNYNTYYFTWNAVPNAEYYEFQYRAQTNPTWNSLNAGSATSFYHADPPGEYLARVRGVSGTTMGPWSLEEEYSVGAP